MFPDLPPLHTDGWQPHHVDKVCLGMPMMRDVPEMWAEWIDQHPDKHPWGIVAMPDGHISMCGIHGMQLIKWCNPQAEVVEQQQTQYLFIAAQLFTSPRAYWEAIQRLHLTIILG